jgi:uncharacterized protein (DUF885 family)
MIERLESADRGIDTAIDWMRKGLENGITPPRVTLRDVPQQIRNQLVDDPNQSPLLAAFQTRPENLDALQWAGLQARAASAFSERIGPAYERLLAFVRWRGLVCL